MNVLLVANYEPDAQKSMLAFRDVLARELPSHGCQVRIVAPTKLLLKMAVESRWSKWLGYIAKYILFIPSLCRSARWADVVHICDHSNAMYVRWIANKPNVITCHDVIAIQAAKGMVPGWNVSGTGRLFQRLIARGLGRSDLIACVSHLTRRALLALRLANEGNATTVLNGLNDDFSPVPLEVADGLLSSMGVEPHDTYLIHVGLDLPRKNRKAVVMAFIALHRRAVESGASAIVRKLVLVGPVLAPDTVALAQELGVAHLILAVQDVSHKQLCALYSRATALLFPSLQEGFGWPVIEAQACGCPVFTSDLAPMNEIAGAGACYIDPNDAAATA
ncbi:glycosyltransferase [Variovorax sp. RT4R15]|uniref:glycosyltransferase n=1 Tax=Variovorax sp. RT4R15 TaxID=3443737 RepID=UPI003F483C02